MAQAQKVASRWLRKRLADALEQQLRGQRFRHPETGNQVLFVSLPPDEQAKIRARYQQVAPKQQQAPEPQGTPDGAKAPETPAEPKGPWTERVMKKVREVVDGAKKVGKNFVKFLSDKEYRREVGEQFRAKKADFKEKFANEMRESTEMLKVADRVLSGHDVPEEERKVAIEQLKDIGKMAVLGALALAPLGPLDDVLFFAISAGVKLAFPEFTWMPSSWRTPIEASSGDLADKLSARLYEGIQRALENPSEDLVLAVLEEMKSREKTRSRD